MAKAEIGALFTTANEIVPMRHTLIDIGRPQPPSPIQTDNFTAVGVVNDTIIARIINSMDLRLHWLLCQEEQQQLCF